jgi:hypothetical protein
MQPGKCFRLITELKFNSLEEYTIPEMQRTEISGAILQLKALGIDDVLHFDFLSSPPSESMIYSLELLFSLGALDDNCKLTEIGEKMSGDLTFMNTLSLIYIYMDMYIHVFIFVYVNTYIYIYMYVLIYTCTCIHICIHMFLCIHICTSIHTDFWWKWVCMYIYSYACLSYACLNLTSHLMLFTADPRSYFISLRLSRINITQLKHIKYHTISCF